MKIKTSLIITSLLISKSLFALEANYLSFYNDTKTPQFFELIDSTCINQNSPNSFTLKPNQGITVKVGEDDDSQDQCKDNTKNISWVMSIQDQSPHAMVYDFTMRKKNNAWTSMFSRDKSIDPDNKIYTKTCCRTGQNYIASNSNPERETDKVFKFQTTPKC
ncbi:hypothetical protein N8865_02460 [Francisellaceae bacterium]|nr:hypothetical protein [Francisellaceae bacterium]